MISCEWFSMPTRKKSNFRVKHPNLDIRTYFDLSWTIFNVIGTRFKNELEKMISRDEFEFMYYLY